MRLIVSFAGTLAALVGCAESKGNFPSQFRDAKPATEITADFEKDEVGAPPSGFVTALTGGGGPVKWVIQEDEKAPSGKKVLAQTSSDSTDYRFPLCVLKDFSAKDVEVSVQFKSVSGQVDQAGGLIARYRDKDNYYIVRANALEDNVRLYHVVKGDRVQFAGVSTKVASGQWHTLKLSVKGNHFQVFFNDRPLFEAVDDTFKEAGSAGMWTKADSVTRFDNFRAASYDAK
ncbi:MAG TPA: family 16 glycoside hydrolase [Tepidisphaeraceae bacterium]|jgi:hypothetical protein|nr:family 16 glycoside hydrolase [Tepidisphaeraceae bacterium]